MGKVCLIAAPAARLWHRLRGMGRLDLVPSGFPAIVVFSLGLVAMVATGVWHKSTVHALSIDYCSPEAYTGAIVARDGQKLSDQTSDIQEGFENMWGEEAAARWVFEHNCTLGSGYPAQTPSVSDQCPYTEYTGALVARDGRVLSDNSEYVQNLFNSTWGTHAPARWVYEHNCALGSETKESDVLTPGSDPVATVTPTQGLSPESDPIATVTPTQSLTPNSDPVATVTPIRTPTPGSTDDPSLWHGYYVAGDIGLSWERLCNAFLDYEVPHTHTYASGNEALLHPLYNAATGMYLEECQREPH